MFFMRHRCEARQSKFSQVDRDEMIAFISRPCRRGEKVHVVQAQQARDVKLIRAVERPGMGVPCPALVDSDGTVETAVKTVKTPIMSLMFR